MFLDKHIKEVGASTDYPIFESNISSIINTSTNDIFLSQYKGNNFNGYDIVVKYLAVENFYKKNDKGFYLYNKMQLHRTNKIWTERFNQLIKSFENGYMEKSFIETDINYSIHDGAHRIALSLFHDIHSIPVQIFNTNLYRRPYGIDWFYENGFTTHEVDEIQCKFLEMEKKFNLPYYFILWPPARKVFDEIIKTIYLFSDEIEVISTKEVLIHCTKLKDFFYKIYATDDILKHKLDLKYEHMLDSLSADGYSSDYLPIKILEIKFKKLDFRMKPLTGIHQSKNTMEIKKIIRDKFQQLITNYYYDIIMHTTDNNIQNKEVKKILKKEFL